MKLEEDLLGFPLYPVDRSVTVTAGIPILVSELLERADISPKDRAFGLTARAGEATLGDARPVKSFAAGRAGLQSPRPVMHVRPPKKFVPTPFDYHQEIELEIDSLTNLGAGVGRVGRLGGLRALRAARREGAGAGSSQRQELLARRSDRSPHGLARPGGAALSACSANAAAANTNTFPTTNNSTGKHARWAS